MRCNLSMVSEKKNKMLKMAFGPRQSEVAMFQTMTQKVSAVMRQIPYVAPLCKQL